MIGITFVGFIIKELCIRSPAGRSRTAEHILNTTAVEQYNTSSWPWYRWVSKCCVFVVHIGSCDVAMCHWSILQALSSLLGLAQGLRLCAVMLLCCLDLLTSDTSWCTEWHFDVSKFRPEKADSASTAQCQSPDAHISLVSNSTSVANLFIVLCRCCIVLVSVPTQSNHWHNSH
jgi:hypothetical protein